MCNYPVEVMERGNVLARIDYDGERYTLTNYDSRVSGSVDRFRDRRPLVDYLNWAYPKADELKGTEDR